ncbi:MAG: radical SAM protein, partial [Muribaculaceae bacterium]|nr:radical SAM protein [Muribaculaceae bacterium]
MQTILFHSTIFGPIHSRRLGTSLGVNLSPVDGKVCTFDCLYCEAGYNAQGPGRAGLPTRQEVRTLLRAKLEDMRLKGEPLDVITFSGNGEPTVHPEFEGIIDDTIAARDEFFPDVRISVLCNSTQLHRPDVCRALRRVDNNILKLDSAVEATMRRLDRPASPAFTLGRLIPQLAAFGSNAIIQTMLTRGSHDGSPIDNTTDAEIQALIDAYRAIK